MCLTDGFSSFFVGPSSAAGRLPSMSNGAPPGDAAIEGCLLSPHDESHDSVSAHQNLRYKLSFEERWRLHLAVVCLANPGVPRQF